MYWPDVAAVSSLLAHLSAYGEVYPGELDRAAREWLPLLTEAGWIRSVTGGAHAVTSRYLALDGNLSESERRRQVCFAIPGYRRYLVGVLAHGLVQAGQLEDYHARLEHWVTGDLADLSSEINVLMNELEDGQGRMVNRARDKILDRFSKWYSTYSAPPDWDRDLLGLSTSPDQLFTVVLSHVAAFKTSQSAAPGDNSPLALLPSLDIPLNVSGHLVVPEPAPWSTARQSVHSSLRFFDMQGNPLYNTAYPVPIIWQDTLALQPYYRAVLRVAIAVRLSGYGTHMLSLFVPDGLGSVRVLVDGRERGALDGLLPHLVETLGYRASCQPSPAQVERILEHWAIVGALEIRGSQVLLREPYAQTLHERRRALMLMRGKAVEEQKRLEDYLKERA